MSAAALIDEHHLHADGMRSHAIYSPCQRYRYLLSHVWDDASPAAAFVCLNPSTATAYATDPTLARIIGYAKRWEMGGVVMLNLFALRSTNPRGLLECDDPVGPENDVAILARAGRADTTFVCAWGGPYSPNALGKLVRLRALAVKRLLAGKPLHCLATAKGGEPRHPLYLSSSLVPLEWSTNQKETK